MKKNTLYNALSFLMVFLSMVSFGFGQTTLSAGDIAITGFNSTDPDQFSFVLLKQVESGTSINFTDNGWLAVGGFRGYNPSTNTMNEGAVTWIADVDLSCGTEIIIAETGTNTGIYAATSGTATESDGGFGLALAGDQILAYQGTKSSPNFIYALNFDSAGWSDSTSTNNTALPTGLTNGAEAVDVGEIDNGTYDCNITSDIALILSSVSNVSNWTLDNAPIPIGGCYYSCEACAGGSVTWNGTWSGIPDLTTQVIISANYNTSNGGSEISFSACSLKVEDGAILTIADNTFIEVQNDLTVNGRIIVNPYGDFVQIDDLGIVNGDVLTTPNKITVVKKTSPLNAWYEYTYWSSPVSGETIDSALAESEVTRRFSFNSSLFNDEFFEVNNDNSTNLGQDDIDDEGDDWVLESGSTVMQPGVGYAATHSEDFFILPPMATLPFQFDYTFEGPFNNGVVEVPMSRNDITTADNNWNLVGNPYPSSISAQDFINQNIYNATTNPTGVIEGAIYLWSQNTPPSSSANGNEDLNFSDADYAVMNGIGGSKGGDTDRNGDNIIDSNDDVIPYIPSGQAFLVNFSDNYPSNTGTVIFNNAMRTKNISNSNLLFKGSNKKTKSVNNKLWINLTSDNGVFNQILIGYDEKATNNDDGAYFDAQKIVSPNTYAALYSKIENSSKKFVIQGKASASLNEDEIIQLGFSTKINVATLYKLSIAQLQGDFLTNTPIYLKDNLLNKTHDLSVSDYTFPSDVGEFNTRFEILFSANSLTTEDAILDSKSLRIVALENDRVQFNVADNLSIKTVRIYDLLGRELYNLKGNSNSETYNLSNLNDAIYIAKVELSNGALITKKAVKR